MITENGMNQTKNKLTRFIGTLKSLMFRPVGSIETTLYQTKQPLNEIPDASLFKPADSPAWGGDGVYGWFKGEYTVPAELDGKAIFLWPRMKFYEATLWVNGKIHSNYAANLFGIVYFQTGPRPCGNTDIIHFQMRLFRRCIPVIFAIIQITYNTARSTVGASIDTTADRDFSLHADIGD